MTNNTHTSTKQTLSPDEIKDLELIKEMKKQVDKGNDIEMRRAPGGGYKILIVSKKNLISLTWLIELAVRIQPSGLSVTDSPVFLLLSWRKEVTAKRQ